MYNGIQEITDKGSELIAGMNDVKRKYFEDWYKPDDKSGMNYEEKTKKFLNEVLVQEMSCGEKWKPFATEQSFEFVYDNRVIISGFIDRIDAQDILEKWESYQYLEREGNWTEGQRLVKKPMKLRVVDYKTSKKIFDDAKVKTPLQMIIYALACIFLYGVLPEEYLYNFIFIGQKQEACSKGYLERGLKKLDKLLNTIDELALSGDYAPSPTPLCYWCEYAGHTPNADPKLKHLCPYYSLWTPDKKCYTVNQAYNAVDKGENNMKTKEEVKPVRKLVF